MFKKFLIFITTLVVSLPLGLVSAGSGGELSSGVPMQGEITEANEQDVFTYNGHANEALTIWVIAIDQSLDTFVELYDPNGDLVDSNDDSLTELDTTNSEIQTVLSEDGEYRVVVQAFAGVSTGAYEVIVISEEGSTEPPTEQPTEPAPSDQTTPEPLTSDEPPTQTSGNTIAYGETATGELTLNEPVTFHFVGTAGEFVRVVVTAEIDTWVEIHDPSGVSIAYDDDSGPDVNPYIRSLRLPADGEYEVVLASFFEGEEGSYELTIEQIATVSEETIQYGETLSSELEGGGVSVFNFDGTAGEVVTVTVEGTFDSVLDLLAPSYQVVATDDDSGGLGQPALYEIPLPESGTYSISVTGYDYTQTGTFNITINTVTGTAATTGEPIAYGETVEGNMSSSGVARYLFNGTAGDVVSIAVEAQFDGYLELYDSNGELIASDDDGGGSLNPLISGFELPQDGEYRIEVSTFGGSAGGAYTLTLDSGEDVLVIEPGGGTMIYGETAGSELTAGNTATYNFTAEAGDVVTISVTADFDGYLELRDPQGTIVASDDDSGEGLNPLLENITLGEAGEYTITLGTFSGQDQGGYEISLTAGGEVVVEPPSTGDTGEAQIISIGEQVTATLEIGATKQFVFNGEAGDVVSLAASPADSTNTELDLYFEVYTPSGVLLAADDDSGWQYNPAVAGIELPESGTYRVDVSSFGGVSGGDFLFVSATDVNYFAPNGDPARGILVVEGGTSTVELTNSGLFNFDAVAGQTLTVSSNFMTVDLYSADGATEVTLTPDSAFEIPTDGTYLLFAYSLAGGGQDTVEIVLSGAGTTPPEAVFNYGGEIAVDVPANASIGANEVQTWTFKPLLNGDYTFVLNSQDTDKRYDPYLVLRDADGTIIAEDDDSGGEFNPLIEGVALTGGQTVTLEVSSFAGQSGGDFLLAVVADSLEALARVEGGELSLGEAASATLDSPSQLAEFTLNLEADSTYAFTLDGLKLPYIDIYDDAGNLVGRGVGTIKNQKLPAGSYQVLVYDRLNRTGDFTLTVENVSDQE